MCRVSVIVSTPSYSPPSSVDNHFCAPVVELVPELFVVNGDLNIWVFRAELLDLAMRYHNGDVWLATAGNGLMHSGGGRWWWAWEVLLLLLGQRGYELADTGGCIVVCISILSSVHVFPLFCHGKTDQSFFALGHSDIGTGACSASITRSSRGTAFYRSTFLDWRACFSLDLQWSLEKRNMLGRHACMQVKCNFGSKFWNYRALKATDAEFKRINPTGYRYHYYFSIIALFCVKVSNDKTNIYTHRFLVWYVDWSSC